MTWSSKAKEVCLTNQYLAPVSFVAQAVSDGDLQSCMKMLPQEEPGPLVPRSESGMKTHMDTSPLVTERGVLTN